MDIIKVAEGEITQTLGELNIENPTICAIGATNRRGLIDYINRLIPQGFLEKHPGAIYLHIELKDTQSGCCGGSVRCMTEADIPEHSVPCPCGNPKHWLIKYEEDDT